MSLSYENITHRPDAPCIRLLHLRPQQEGERLVEADLEVVSLSTEPKFEALSYTWGNVKRKGAMRCNGAIIDTTKNLFSALTHLRHPDRVRVLWVDYLCINQEDNTEKADQVGRMGSIYKSADRVLIWLGPASHMSDVAFKFINRAFDQLRRSKPSILQEFAEDTDYQAMAVDFPSIFARFEREAITSNSGLSPSGSSAAHKGAESDEGSSLSLPKLTNKEQYAFAKLMKRAWWSRVWIIQELSLSSEAVVCCGESSAPWEAFGFSLVNADEDDDSFLMHEIAWYQVLANTRLKLRETDVQPTLLQALSVFRWSQATKPEDKVYALLGITRNIDIRPDYTISVGSCYQRTAQAILSNSETLDLLDYVVLPSSYRRNKIDVPSWVPDWSYDETSIQYDFASPRLSGLTHSIHTITGDRVGQTMPLLESRPSFIEDNILVLKGRTIDSVEALEDIIRMPTFSMPFTSMELPDTWLERLSNGLQAVRLVWRSVWVISTLFYRMGAFIHFSGRAMEFAERASPDQEDGNNRLHCLSQLISAFKHDIVSSELDEQKGAEAFCKFWDFITMSKACRIFRLFGLHWISPFLYKYLLAYLAKSLADEEDVDADIEAVGFFALCIDQRPALTRRERRLCVVPHTCRVGDQVALLRGGRHPYIVRPAATPGRWELVGPCYIDHSYMEKLRQEWRDENTQDMEFE